MASVASLHNRKFTDLQGQCNSSTVRNVPIIFITRNRGTDSKIQAMEKFML
jgi:uncharacterized alpha/beta hydrolase family protein